MSRLNYRGLHTLGAISAISKCRGDVGAYLLPRCTFGVKQLLEYSLVVQAVSVSTALAAMQLIVYNTLRFLLKRLWVNRHQVILSLDKQHQYIVRFYHWRHRSNVFFYCLLDNWYARQSPSEYYLPAFIVIIAPSNFQLLLRTDTHRC